MAQLTEEQLQVVVSAVTAEFSKSMADAKAELVAFGKAGTTTWNSAKDAEKSFADELTKGQTKRELRLIGMELGSMAGAGSAAGREVGALLGVLRMLDNGLGLAVAGSAALVTAFLYLFEANKKENEEMEKAVKAGAEFADVMEKAKVAGIALAGPLKDFADSAQRLSQISRADEIQKSVEELERLRESLGKGKSAFLSFAAGVFGSTSAQAELNERTEKTNELITIQEGRIRALQEGYKDAKDQVQELVDEQKFQIDQEDKLRKGAFDANIRRTKEFDAEVARSNKANEAELKREKKSLDDYNKSTSAFQKDFVRMIDNAAAGTQKLSTTWKQFSKDLIKDAEAAMASAAVKKLFDLLGGFLFNAGGDKSTGNKGFLGNLLKNIPIIGGAFAGGGTFATNGPTLFLAGEGSDPRETVSVSPYGQSSSGGGVNVEALHIVVQASPGTTSSQSFAAGQSAAAGFADGIARMGFRLGSSR